MKKWVYALMLSLLVFGGCINENATKDKVSNPKVSPSAGTYTSTQTVTLLTDTDGATIYYTLDGTKPGTIKYTAPISISTTTTLMAVAKKDGMDDSDVITAKYVIQNSVEKVAAPVITPAAGTYTTTQAITITTATTGASIYYTTDGTTPSVASTKYTAAFNITKTTTVKAIAIKDGMDNSDVVTADYIITAEVAKTADLFFSEYVECAGGNNKALEVYNPTDSDIVLRTGDTNNYFMMKLGNTTAGDTWASSNAKPFLFADGNSIKSGEVFVVYNAGADDLNITSTGDLASTITYYNGNDDLALVKDVNHNGTYEADTDKVIDVIGKMDGTDWGKDTTLERKATVTTGNTTFNLDEWNVLPTNTFDHIGAFTGRTVVLPVINPEFSLASGTYTTTQAITITTATTGASIYYTIDGTTPSAISTKYTAALNISTTTTVKAIGIKDGLVSSSVVTAVYVIDTNATPTYEESFAVDKFEDRGWAITAEAGTKKWYYSSGVAKMGAYKSGEDSNISWMVSPKLSIGDSSVMTFESAQGYSKDGTELKVLVSEDYSGDTATATWTELTFVLADESASGYGDFKSSGDVSLADYKDKNIVVAFKYIGSGNNNQTTTYEIKNLKIVNATK
ncbi:chitobiase/beta-hexosaminidase C-terminal domain-containing protein [Haliovirga abyssi]|uniref:GH29D-like beta-sandwich domain-containing protein n=1 Tax=Haliovirga abyssi TaxID=2996794 RepID=A0AAU9DCZ0_9FUSO|nr:chitobiase/beta-hexosaminidase C-terminal domain-containing protein [Haliovirga abyssi]BDU51381.1 hypothetical protein HLVA_19500 [Haliovirga abyssi]